MNSGMILKSQLRRKKGRQFRIQEIKEEEAQH